MATSNFNMGDFLNKGGTKITPPDKVGDETRKVIDNGGTKVTPPSNGSGGSSGGSSRRGGGGSNRSNNPQSVQPKDKLGQPISAPQPTNINNLKSYNNNGTSGSNRNNNGSNSTLDISDLGNKEDKGGFFETPFGRGISAAGEFFTTPFSSAGKLATFGTNDFLTPFNPFAGEIQKGVANS